MVLTRFASPICASCRSHLFSIFTDGFCTVPRLRNIQPNAQIHLSPFRLARRTFSVPAARRDAAETPGRVSGDEIDEAIPPSVAEMEAVVRRARQTFGETLPTDFLSSEEFSIYERLYGRPLRDARPADFNISQYDQELVEDEDTAPRNVLLKENEAGDLEEVNYAEEVVADLDEVVESEERIASDEREQDFRARVMLYRDIAAATQSSETLEEAEEETYPVDEERSDGSEEENEAEMNRLSLEDAEREDAEDLEDDLQGSAFLRAHPLTSAGRFSTSPSTLHLPREAFVTPIDAMLADLSRKHLTEVAERTFGGPGLPDSTATPSSKGHLQQKPVALEASQSKMTEMEADVYLAAIMPGAYAAIMSTLVESRKRLGSKWLEELLNKPEGPRVLDAGAGGAGVIAWREILRAEWERLHPGGHEDGAQLPVGKATVITGSPELRRRAARLLDNTTFLPRLPDYDAARDLPATPDGESPSRKRYDVVLAPHTLWTLKEDYMRKAQIQNLWALLNPQGGVLIVIEKGVPRGFELVAGAREVLLKNQISSPESERIENELQSTSLDRFTQKETGMIIAPCTNHTQCPMYTIPGRSKGRKDHCHFSQRFIRPPYLQHILGAKERNHEDIRFSYVAIQRGKDLRKTGKFEQGETASEAAFAGYEDDLGVNDIVSSQSQGGESKAIKPHMLSMPRSLMPPLKRRGHVTLDLCTPSGRLERWTVPKSFSKQAYRDARKSRWGDLWALGAKTRVVRTARVGSPKEGGKKQRVYKVNVGANESEDRIQGKLERGEKQKRNKKGERSKKQRVYKEDVGANEDEDEDHIQEQLGRAEKQKRNKKGERRKRIVEEDLE